jgi:hypothetical protein
MSVSKPKASQEFVDPTKRGPIFSVRFLIALALIALGIAWVLLWTLHLRDVENWETTIPREGTEPDALLSFMPRLDDWNWLVGFGLLFVGLGVAAHKSTPLGRGRGVLVGMLGCFLIGLIWICTFYVFADKISEDPNSIFLLGSLGQLNLVVGIGFMAVGFTFATKWE